MKDQHTAARRLRVAPRAAGFLLPALCFVVALASFNTARQPRAAAAQQPDLTIDAATRTQVIEGALKNLREAYVYPEVATRMEQAIRERAAKKEYEGITSARQLAQTLTEHLQAVSRDKHLRVRYSPEGLPEGRGTGGPIVIQRGTGDGAKPPVSAGGNSPPLIRRGEGGGGIRGPGDDPNAGIEKVERLEGNIGLLEFSRFVPLTLAADKVSEAMNKLADTDALIIDLRRNGGGASGTIRFLMSYFFDKPVHLNDYYNRVEDRTDSIHTLAEVPGKRYGDKPIYILTSSRTFSAAESISYSLKNLKRATIVGEMTGGGAHPVSPRRLGDHFVITVPSARYISAVTKTNWEGVGVEPDVKVPAAHALKVAQLAALKKLAADKGDAQAAAQLKVLVEALQKEVDELKKESSKS